MNKNKKFLFLLSFFLFPFLSSAETFEENYNQTNATYISQVGGFDNTLGRMLNLTEDDGLLFSVQRVNDVVEGDDLGAFLVINYSLSDLTNKTGRNYITNITFQYSYCINSNSTENHRCGTPTAVGTANNPQRIDIYNFSSNSYLQVSNYTLNLSDQSEINVTYTLLGNFSDFVESSGLISVRYEVDVALGLDEDSTYGVDYVRAYAQYIKPITQSHVVSVSFALHMIMVLTLLVFSFLGIPSDSSLWIYKIIVIIIMGVFILNFVNYSDVAVQNETNNERVFLVSETRTIITSYAVSIILTVCLLVSLITFVDYLVFKKK